MKHLDFFLQKVLGFQNLGSCQNCMNSANPVSETLLKLSNQRALNPGKPCTCEYVTLSQSFHKGT